MAAVIRAPVVVVAGSTAKDDTRVAEVAAVVRAGFERFAGTVVCGGTRIGVGALVGDLAEASGGRIEAVGYLPRDVPATVEVETDRRRYARLVRTEGSTFSVLEPLRYWQDIVASGIEPASVRVLGIGGGSLSLLEYRLAIALGAQVALVAPLHPGVAASPVEPLELLPIDSAALARFLGVA
jgi:hypothetical protein